MLAVLVTTWVARAIEVAAYVEADYSFGSSETVGFGLASWAFSCLAFAFRA